MIHSISSHKCKKGFIASCIMISSVLFISGCGNSGSVPPVSILDQRDHINISEDEWYVFQGGNDGSWDGEWMYAVARPSGDLYNIHEEVVNNTDKPGKTGEQGNLQWSYLSAFFQKYGLLPIQGYRNDQLSVVQAERNAVIANHELVGADPYLLYPQWSGHFDENNRYSYLVDKGYELRGEEQVPYLLFYGEHSDEGIVQTEMRVKVLISNDKYYLKPLNQADLEIRFSDVNLQSKKPETAYAVGFESGVQQIALNQYTVQIENADGEMEERVKYGVKGYVLYRDYTVPEGYQYEEGEVNRYYTLEYELYTLNHDLVEQMVKDLGYETVIP